jgi:hypothetical protein
LCNEVTCNLKSLKTESINLRKAIKTHNNHHTMIFLKPLAVLNNEGVRLYELGKLQEASNYFQLAIDEMVKLLIQIKHERSTATEETSDSQQEQLIRRTAPQSAIQGWSRPLPHTKRPGDEVFVFSRAIRLRESSEILRTPTQESGPGDLSIYKLAMQFNKALVHHQIATLTVKSKYYSTDAEMAFHMYEQAFQSCKSESTRDSFYCTVDRGIIMTALFNNVGAIFCNELARYHDASECFKAACRVVFGMDLSQLGQTLDSDEMYLLSMNIWMAPKIVAPAA